MQNFQIYRNLAWLNELNADEAESVFRDCCGSRQWADLMAASRPFASENELIDRAAEIWNDLDNADRLEAFDAHPKIGETKAAPKQQARSAEWSTGEQAEIISAGDRVKEELAEANRLYQKKFGYIFIVCASGKTADEMLEICRRRLSNNAESEIGVAAEEQRKIIEIRLRKLLRT